jgi:hypothetical protein
MSGVDGPRGVQNLYHKVMIRLKDACKEDFRNDGIDQTVLDTMLHLWFNSLKETRVMHDDQLGDTDRKGQSRQGKGAHAPAKPPSKPKEPIGKDMKRQIEDIVMLAADAVVTPRLVQLLQQHSTDAMRMRPQPSTIKILQTHGWDGSRFLGRVDGKLLRKLADALVVYIHRSSRDATDEESSIAASALTTASSAAAASARIPQADGAADGSSSDDDGWAIGGEVPATKRRRTRYGEDSSDDEGDDAGIGESAATEAAAAAAADEESDLNSDDDDLLSEAEEETSLILCQYKRVKKSKNKYTLDLQNGLMRVFLPHMGDYGREYVISRAQANLDWGK